MVCWSPEKLADAIWLKDTSQVYRLENVEYPPHLIQGNGRTAVISTLHRVNEDRLSIYRWNLPAGQVSETHLEGLARQQDLLSASRDGQLLALKRGNALAVVGSVGDNELTRIEFPAGHRIAAALTTEDAHLAFNGPQGEIWVADLKQLRAHPRWHITIRDGRNQLEPLESTPAIAAVRSGQPPVRSLEGAQAAIAALRAVGVKLPDEPDSVHSVNTYRTKFVAEHAPLLAQFAQIQHLSLFGAPDAPALLAALPELPTLRVLELANSPIADDDLKHLAKFPGLNYLELQNTKVRGPGFEHLRGLAKLDTLSIPHDLPREAVGDLVALTQLKRVGNWPSGLTDDDLAQIATMQNLTDLELRNARVRPQVYSTSQGCPSFSRSTFPKDCRPAHWPHWQIST